MEVMMPFRRLTLALCAALAAAPAAAGPAEIRDALAASARAVPGFAGFSAERGRRFFETAHATDWSCATCHRSDPAAPGRHAATGKQIAPLAPAANPKRFTDPARVEKWFARNCNDVLKRPCSAQEKGDVLAYLMSVGGR
jgi:hypothetical protein